MSNTTEYEQAPVGTTIIPDVRTQTGIFIESDSYFLCPPNTVMTGRWHNGDENGQTQYQYATLKAVNVRGESVPGNITVEDIIWHPAVKESDGMGSDWHHELMSDFHAPEGYIILGRQHMGGLTGDTRYKIGKIFVNNIATTVEPAESIVPYQIYHEPYGVFFQTKPYLLYTGRSCHLSDGIYNLMGLVRVNK